MNWKEFLEFWSKFLLLKIFYWSRDEVLTTRIRRSVKSAELEREFNRVYTCKGDIKSLNFVKHKNWGSKRK
jgi:hypothetical protein